MNIVAWVLMVASAAYLVAGISEGLKGSHWWFGFWFAYAFANFCWLKATNAF